jgi:phosphomannomutase
MSTLRKRPPERLGGRTVESVDDLLAGVRHCARGGEQRLDLPSSDVIALRTDDATRAVVRPSGTEPKLKLYLQIVLEVGHEEVARVRCRAGAELDRLADELKTALGA